MTLRTTQEGEAPMANVKWMTGLRMALVVGLLAGLTAVPTGAAGATTTADPDLTVTKDGLGSGTVTSDPSGISCGTDCDHAYPMETVEDCAYDPEIGRVVCTFDVFTQDVTLTATADAGSTFTGWSGGGCSGTEPCEVTMDEDKTVTATFTDTQNPVVSSVSPTSGNHQSSMTATATASDNVGVWYLSTFVYQDGDLVGFLGTDSEAPFQFSMDNLQVTGENGLSDGPVKLQVQARDTSGNWSAYAFSNFTIDDTSPALEITAGPAEGSSSPDPRVTFDFSAVDEWSDVSAVECALHETLVAADFAPCSHGMTQHRASVAPGGASDGDHIFSVRATDGAGNATTVSRAWTVTRMPTVLSLGVDKTRRKVNTGGVLRENWEDERRRIGDATVTTTLFKKKKGRFVKLSSKKRVTDPSDGRYAVSFRRPNAGTCKLTASFAATDIRRGSKKSTRFNC